MKSYCVTMKFQICFLEITIIHNSIRKVPNNYEFKENIIPILVNSIFTIQYTMLFQYTKKVIKTKTNYSQITHILIEKTR